VRELEMKGNRHTISLGTKAQMQHFRKDFKRLRHKSATKNIEVETVSG